MIQIKMQRIWRMCDYIDKKIMRNKFKLAHAKTKKNVVGFHSVTILCDLHKKAINFHLIVYHSLVCIVQKRGTKMFHLQSIQSKGKKEENNK